MTKAVPLKNINLNNVLDIMFEPDKNKYSILEYSGSRKIISKKDFYSALTIYENNRRK